ncbi:MAG TPA: SpoIIE family protein phosphatase [Acidobacteriota bacterium]|nr:SpoIIE family protein phosphatase [Acidobacteriota bacterium]
MPIIRVEQKHEKPFEVDLVKDLFTIGRSSGNDLAFNHLSLSRHHAKIVKDKEAYTIEDAGSRNGTFLNGTKIAGATTLNSGDVIQLGEIILRFIEPFSDKLRVTDTGPVFQEATFMIDSNKFNLQRYAEESKERSVSPTGGEENIWPALNQAAAALITHYPIEQLLEVVMNIVFAAVPAERGALILRDPKVPDKLDLRVVRSAFPDQALQISRTIIQEVTKNQKAVLTLDAQTDDRFGSAQSIQMQGIRSIICVPLYNNREVIGLIYIDNLISKRTFTQSDLRLIALIANMAAVKIENELLVQQKIEMKRLEEQLAVAAQIQRKLLPQSNPEVPNYQLYGVNRSCYEIGGDYYDFIPKNDGKIAIVIADVSGKGVGAALLMASFQASIRALVNSEPNLANFMEQLNQVMIANSPPNKYITVFYGELDATNHTFEYVNAGHNPPIHMSKNKSELLTACGPVVGIVPTAKYQKRLINLERGDLLFLYTDGITESQDPEGAEFGEQGAIEFLSKNRETKLDELSQMLEEHIRDFTKAAPPVDDSTLIFLRRAS